MKVIDLKAQAIAVDVREGVLTVVKDKNTGTVKLVKVRYPKFVVEELYSFSGKKCLLLSIALDLYLVSIDNTLFVSYDLADWRKVLEVRNGNTLWHVCETPWGVVVQEYGEPPTSLWISKNGFHWRRLFNKSGYRS